MKIVKNIWRNSLAYAVAVVMAIAGAAVCLPAQGQVLGAQQEQVTGVITAQNSSLAGVATANSAVEMITVNRGVIGVQIGTTAWTAVGGLTAYCTLDSTNWTVISSFTAIPSGTTNTVYKLDASGCTRVRVTAPGAVTGNATLTLRSTPFAAGGSGGGGTSDATAVNQVTGNNSLASIDTKTPALVSGRVPVDGSGVTQPVSAAALPLPAGAATSANQSTQITAEQATQTSVASIDTKTPTASSSANATPVRWPVSLDLATPVTGTSAAAGVLSNMPFAVGKGAQGVIVDITAFTATSVLFEQSSDGTAAYVVTLCYPSTATGAGSRATSTAATGKWECPVWGTHFRLSQTGSGGVTATVTPIARPIPSVTPVYVANTPNIIGQASQGSSVSPYPFMIGYENRTTTGTAVTNGQVVRGIGTTDGKGVTVIGSVPELAWNYAAAASGIVNTTTAVTVKTACTDRCYINRLDLMCEALTNATEFVVRDGAATVLYRTKVGTAGLPLTSITFQPPRRGASGQLIEVATLTASGAGACYANLDGYDAK